LASPVGSVAAPATFSVGLTHLPNQAALDPSGPFASVGVSSISRLEELSSCISTRTSNSSAVP